MAVARKDLLCCTSDTTQQKAVQSMCLSLPVCFEKPQTSQGKYKYKEEGWGVMWCGADKHFRLTLQQSLKLQKHQEKAASGCKR